MAETLKLVLYPDPRLKAPSAAVNDFSPALGELAARMFALMREQKGVGLAAPQVGRNIRLFIMNPTGKPEDDRVIINPVLSNAEGEEEDEEGCLSIPELHVKVWRAKKLRVTAHDLNGKTVVTDEEGYVARVIQHEADHLNGVLLTDRMGAVAKIANRGLLRELDAKFKKGK